MHAREDILKGPGKIPQTSQAVTERPATAVHALHGSDVVLKGPGSLLSATHVRLITQERPGGVLSAEGAVAETGMASAA